MSVRRTDVSDTNAADGLSVGRTSRWVWLTWLLAALTVPAAIFIVLLALGGAMSTAGCSGEACPDVGPQWLFAVLLYGAPAVAVLTMIASIFVSKRRDGFLVPLFGLLLLAADLVVLAVLFRS